jgi:hypothetical protein
VKIHLTDQDLDDLRKGGLINALADDGGQVALGPGPIDFTDEQFAILLQGGEVTVDHGGVELTVAAGEPGLDRQLKAGWQRYNTARRALIDLTLREIARRVKALAPAATAVHLALRSPDEVGAPDRWLVAGLYDAAGRRIALTPDVESDLGDALHEPLDDLAELAAVTDAGHVDLVAEPPTLSAAAPGRLG